MFTYRALNLFCVLGLVMPSILAGNQSHALALNITGANPFDYVIPNTTPPVTIAFSNWSPERVTPVDPPSVYMCAIENLGRICRQNPRRQEISSPISFTYGTVTIRFDCITRRSEPYFTQDAACAVLRGLLEYMTVNNWWVESFVHVISEGYIVGTAQVWDPNGKGSVAPMELVGAQSSAGSDGTA